MSRSERFRRLFRPGGAAGLIVLSGLVGISAGLGAVVLIEAIKLVTDGASRLSDLLHMGRAAILVVLPLGIWLAWRLAAWLAPEVSGHGVPHIIASLQVRGGHIAARIPALKTVATALTIGSGGSAGREGSIAQIGAGMGSWLGRVTKLGEDDIKTLVAAGAGAGIRATFNAPIAGMFFAMEVLLGKFAARHLHTVVVASVAGAVVSHSILGEELTFRLDPYAFDHPSELVLYAALGLVAVGFAWIFLEGLDRFEIMPERLPTWVRPLALGGIVALVGLFQPEVLGTGQVFIGEVLRGEVAYTWWVLGGLAILKALATSATLGAKGAGGIFMPSLFIGATAGAAFAYLLLPYWGFSELQPGAYALVGMAATFAAVARAPLTSILIVFEITGDYGLVLPLMVATSIAAFLAGRVRPLSAYAAPLARMGIHVTALGDTDLLGTVRVGEVADRAPAWTAPEESLTNALGTLHRHRLHRLPVIDQGRLVGIVSESDISRAGGPTDNITVAQAMTPNPVTVTPDAVVSEALVRMAALGVGGLPVVSAEDPGLLVGMFKRENIVHAYQYALSAASRQHKAMERIDLRSETRERFFEFAIPENSVADGRTVSEVAWPEGCLLVSIHRGSNLLVAAGNTRLRAGDAITAFGGDEARQRLIERLARPVEES